MKTIHLAKVYESLEIKSDGRIIGWELSQKDMEKTLQNFGDECRWSFAVIEEIASGMHGATLNATWFKYDNDFRVWITIEKDWNNDFMCCFGHTIG